jgi:hypothetical protein
LLILFLPHVGALVRLYYLILIIGAVVLIATKEKLYFDSLTLIGIGIVMYYTFFTVLRFFFIVEVNIRDFTEVARLSLPLLLLIFRDKFKYLTIKTLFIVFAVYTSIDCVISVLNLLNWNIGGIVTATKAIYASPVHAKVVYRITGLSMGPGQHGVIMLVMFCFFYTRVFQSKKILYPSIFSFLSAIPIVLTRTRTTMIGLAFIMIIVPLFFLFNGEKYARRRSLPVLSSCILVGGYFIINFYYLFARAFGIFNGLGNVHTFQMRLTWYKFLLSKAMLHPLFLIFGYGKEYFGTSVFDNEYLLMFLVYGPLITAIFIGGILVYIFNFLKKQQKPKYEVNTILFFIMAVGLIVAFPSYFFLEMTVLPLLFVLINFAFWENRKINTY